MGRYLVVRLYSMALTLLGLTVLVFLMLHLIPGTVVEQMIGLLYGYLEPRIRYGD